MKRAYFMTVIGGVLCLGMRVIHRRESSFNRRHAWLEWDYDQL